MTRSAPAGIVEHGDPADDPRAFRRCLGQFATGVAVMTTLAGGRPVGVTANSFASLSHDPRLVLWSIGAASRSYEEFRQARRFAVNVLDAGQIALSRHFASQVADKFETVEWTLDAQGLPVLPGCLALLLCATEAVHQLGDHALLIGRVEWFMHSDGSPLLYSQGGYATARSHPSIPGVGA